MILILLGLGVAIAAVCYLVRSGKVTAKVNLGGAIPSWDAYGGVFGQYSGLRAQDKL